ncbi:GxxExxY protein [Candidatus Parcubacteria bacterium]|nr:GxxExxY protein [Candidatus Parcubacteria bacterium]
MKEGKLLYEQESYLIRGACFEVWNEFGGAFKEKVIDRAVQIALRSKKLNIETQKRINIYFKNEKVGIYIPDIIVEKKIIIELKCKPLMSKGDIDQFWKYLRGSQYKLGFLINFSPKGLIIKRIVYDTAREKNTSA